MQGNDLKWFPQLGSADRRRQGPCGEKVGRAKHMQFAVNNGFVIVHGTEAQAVRMLEDIQDKDALYDAAGMSTATTRAYE